MRARPLPSGASALGTQHARLPPAPHATMGRRPGFCRSAVRSEPTQIVRARELRNPRRASHMHALLPTATSSLGRRSDGHASKQFHCSLISATPSSGSRFTGRRYASGQRPGQPRQTSRPARARRRQGHAARARRELVAAFEWLQSRGIVTLFAMVMGSQGRLKLGRRIAQAALALALVRLTFACSPSWTTAPC